jgi:hypothetical protein
LRRLRTVLHERGVGPLEIKVRGVDVDPARLRQSLVKKTQGDIALTLLIMGNSSSTRAVLARRVD